MHSEIQMRVVPTPKNNNRSMKRSYTSVNNNDETNDAEYLNESNNISVKHNNASLILEDDSIPGRSRQDLIYVEDITQAIVDFLISDCRPVSLTQGKGFQRLLRLLAPGYTIPDKTKLSNAVRRKYDDMVKGKE